jgi:hypothetical protein
MVEGKWFSKERRKIGIWEKVLNEGWSGIEVTGDKSPSPTESNLWLFGKLVVNEAFINVYKRVT